MSQVLVNAFYSLLISDQAVGSFYEGVSGRIYETQAPINATLPLAVFALVTSTVDKAFGGADIKRATIQVDIYGSRLVGAGSAADVGALNARLFSLIQGATISVVNHDRGVVLCSNEGARMIEEDAVRITSEWTVDLTDF
jgi:hypothetical protein